MSTNDEKMFWMQDGIKLVERCLPLKQWDFRQAARFFDGIYPILIYGSPKCRMRVMYNVAGRYHDHTMVIHYGRIEVRDNADTLLWRTLISRYNRFWHSVRGPLYFLDGVSPQEAKSQKQPRLIREFDESEVAAKIKDEPEKDLALHATIWSTCGQQLFDIFDNRNKDLWQRYCAFEKEYWGALLQTST